MMRLMLAIILSILAASATAATLIDSDGKQWEYVIPPSFWFSRPAPFTVINLLPAEDLREVCRLLGKNERFGCAALYPDITCSVYVDGSLPPSTLNAVIHHETAHCHGWPADHPQ